MLDSLSVRAESDTDGERYGWKNSVITFFSRCRWTLGTTGPQAVTRTSAFLPSPPTGVPGATAAPEKNRLVDNQVRTANRRTRQNPDERSERDDSDGPVTYRCDRTAWDDATGTGAVAPVRGCQHIPRGPHPLVHAALATSA
ncbi:MULTISPECIES: hypothetical protein [Protofrankia]|uniref:hypothetical protein n=1 Tax=Protofrankia TaxID=2994361 RepID=UPI001041A925|nr:MULTISPECIES: hypothetical protein [Protofrankia]